MPTTEEPHSQGQKLEVAISNAVVGVLRDHTGRGPTKARTYIADDLVTCVLRDTLTKGERQLVGLGQLGAVLGMRRAFQSAMRAEASAAIEELVGRKIIGFMSDNHADPDLAIEVFVLESEEGP
jgi:uncharacterized protein YbcI